jgi:hypothetical protein
MVCSESGKKVGWDAPPCPIMSRTARTSRARILFIIATHPLLHKFIANPIVYKYLFHKKMTIDRQEDWI